MRSIIVTLPPISKENARTVHVGYKTFNIPDGWTLTEDTGVEMLECTACRGRVKTMLYLTAVGSNGLRFCPYCGALMAEPEQMSLY